MTTFLWLLKLGSLANLVFLVSAARTHARASILVPAVIVFVVAGYRCAFPVRYEDNVVFHRRLSSIFVTRLLATLSEVAFVLLLSFVLRRCNLDRVGWVDCVAWGMVMQVVVCQVLVWGAIATNRRMLYFWEELGWALLSTANAVASLFVARTAGGLLELNVLFGVLYLPFQIVHLRKLLRDAAEPREVQSVVTGLSRAIREKNVRTDAASWGGVVGVVWMTGYFATLIPLWTLQIVRVLSATR